MANSNGRFLPVVSRLSLYRRTLRYYWTNRSLLAWRRLAVFSLQRMLSRRVPAIIYISITSRCQCRCFHCYAEAHKRTDAEEMTTEEIKSLIDQAKEMGILEVVFFGGEPLLRKDVLALISYAHGAGMITRVDTNGLLLSREMVSRLRKAGLTACCVSLDSTDPEIHDRWRGVPGIFEKVMKGIGYLREFGIPTHLFVVATRSNIPDGLERIRALGKKIGASAMFIAFPLAGGRWAEASGELLTAEERTRVRRFLDSSFVYCELPTPRSLCPHFDRLLFHVTASGDVTPCPCSPFVIGNIRRRRLTDLWARYTTGLNLEFRDDCPVNDARSREVFKTFVESFAQNDRFE